MAALISILLEMPKGDAMSSSGFSIGTTWATEICKEKKLYQSDPGPTPRHPDYIVYYSVATQCATFSEVRDFYKVLSR